MFVKITILQYFNLAIVLVLINFKIGIPFLNELNIFDGTYEDFSQRWYEQLGAGLCFTLFINVFSPQASKVGIPIIHLLMRFKDRGWKRELKGNFDIIETPVKDKTKPGGKAANLSLEYSMEESKVDLEKSAENEGGSSEDIENEGG